MIMKKACTGKVKFVKDNTLIVTVDIRNPSLCFFKARIRTSPGYPIFKLVKAFTAAADRVAQQMLTPLLLVAA